MSLPIDSKPPVLTENGPRNLLGWICFGLMMFLVLVVSLIPGKRAKTELTGHEREQSVLKSVMSAKSLQTAIGNPTGKTKDPAQDMLLHSLDDPISSLVLQAKKDKLAAMLYAEMRTYQKRDVPVDLLVKLSQSKLPEDKAFLQIYTSAKLTKAEADDIVKKLPNTPFVYQAARVQAMEKAGVTDAISKYVSPLASMGVLIISMASLPFLVASMLIWTIFLRKHREKTLIPMGIPMDAISVKDADRLAIRAAQIFAIFILSDLVVHGLLMGMTKRINEAQMGAISGVLTLLSVIALQKAPVEGKKFSLAQLGVSRENLGKNVMLGILGFLAEFPVAMFLGEICAVLFRWLPKATHPAGEALERSHDLRVVIPILISGCIIAPIWEELVYRGLLFPGLNRLLGGLVPGILASSFLFAAIHPQGITVWLPLAFVGGIELLSLPPKPIPRPGDGDALPAQHGPVRGCFDDVVGLVEPSPKVRQRR